MKKILVFTILLCMVLTADAQDLPLLKVSADHYYLETADGQPFFWLGGTAWELLHRCTREEIDLYLEDRAAKGFTVIQTVILAEIDGLRDPNPYGDTPLIDEDPTRWNEGYFQVVDYAVKKAADLGLYMGLLPTWGDKFNNQWGRGPLIFTPENAEEYGKMLGKRYKKASNVIWILGGDRKPLDREDSLIVSGMASGLRSKDKSHLISYHPQGNTLSSSYFDDEWLEIDMYQSGHNRSISDFTFVEASRQAGNARPVINGEARYENIPDRFWEDDPGEWMDDSDVRVTAWRSLLAGAAGYTYGCNDIWQMWVPGREPTIMARTGWKEALQLRGSTHVGYMRAFLEQIPWQRIQNDQGLILNQNPKDEFYQVAARDKHGEYILAYTPDGEALTIDASGLKTEKYRAFWLNPRSGILSPIGEFDTKDAREFKPWSQGRGSDFLLVLVQPSILLNIP